MKPIIGITACLEEQKIYKTNSAYVQAVVRAGGIPVLLPIATPLADCGRLTALLDGLLVPGGVDMAPQFFGEQPPKEVTCVDRALDEFELELIRNVSRAGKPMLCICRGCQVVNVAFGGTLYQDIPTQCPQAHGHYQNTASRSEGYHTVTVAPGTVLASAVGEGELLTNSYHHQAVKDVAPGFTVCARTEDGIVEGIENAGGAILGVQWHPECMEERYPVFRGLFSWLVDKAGQRA